MSRAAAVGLGALRLAVAAALIAATSYVLGWRILYDGLHGSDSLFHLNLASWVASTFPAIGWWYPWDGNGVPYREGYPLVAHWLTVAAARLSGAERYLTYARLDADLARNAAPLVALGKLYSPELFSARIGCQIYGVYGVDLAALCINKSTP